MPLLKFETPLFQSHLCHMGNGIIVRLWQGDSMEDDPAIDHELRQHVQYWEKTAQNMQVDFIESFNGLYREISSSLVTDYGFQPVRLKGLLTYEKTYTPQGSSVMRDVYEHIFTPFEIWKEEGLFNFSYSREGVFMKSLKGCLGEEYINIAFSYTKTHLSVTHDGVINEIPFTQVQNYFDSYVTKKRKAANLRALFDIPKKNFYYLLLDSYPLLRFRDEIFWFVYETYEDYILIEKEARRLSESESPEDEYMIKKSANEWEFSFLGHQFLLKDNILTKQKPTSS